MDIDIDIKPSTDVKKNFPTIIEASMVDNEELKKHLVGYYFQNIPADKKTGYATIPYKEAETFGYKKVDFLNLNMLNNFENKREIRELTKKEPDWTLLEDREVVEKLFHISKHYDTVSKIKPTSVKELADILALIRPNKIGLVDKYILNRNDSRTQHLLYKKTDPSDLRKSHAISYALVIVLQLHLIKSGRIDVYAES